MPAKNILSSKIILQVYKIKAVSDKQKLREFTTTRPALLEMLTDSLLPQRDKSIQKFE